MTDSSPNDENSILIGTADRALSTRVCEVLDNQYLVRIATSADHVGKAIEQELPELLVIDPALYAESTDDQIIALARISPEMHVVVVESTAGPAVDQHRLFKAGVHGFCKHDISDVLLRKAVQLVLDGDYWVQRKLVTQVIMELATERARHPARSDFNRTLVDSLTPRELEVARMVHMGGNNKTIARELDISERTVKAHLSAIFRKLEIQNRLNLALYFSELS